jgi:hypothetical protein
MGLVVVTVDGIGGNAVNVLRHPDDHLSNLTREMLGVVDLEHVDPTWARGGPFQQRRVRKAIERGNSSDNALLCVGKSYGAHNLVKALCKVSAKRGLRYHTTALFTVDVQHLLHNVNHKILRVPPMTHVWNFYQTGRMGGARLDLSKTKSGKNLVVSSSHKDIDNEPAIRANLLELVRIMKPYA